jgi:hypothetical protein
MTEKFSLEFVSATVPKHVKKPPAGPRPRALSKFEKEAKRREQRTMHQIIPATHEETVFRHRDWWEKRKLVDAALVSVGTSERSMERFRECGADSFVYWSPSEQKHTLRGSYCKNRHCVPCQRARGNRLAAALKKKLEGGRQHQYRFITLTLKHSELPLKDQVKRLFSSFKTLRKTALWSDSQKGGAFTLEVKWQEKTRMWHPHLHIIAEGGFMRQSTIAKEWRRITTDSHIVDIKVLSSGKDAAHYVSKYVAKGTTDNVWADRNAAQEWVTAMKGVRVCSTYGTWRGFKLMEKPVLAQDWAPVASLTSVMHAAKAGQQWAMAIVISLRPPGTAESPRTPRPVKPPA